MARKTKLDAVRQKKIVEALRDGNFVTTAANLAGVDDDTVHRWVKRGREEAAEGQQTIYTRFVEDFDRATAEAESTHVAVLKAAARDGEWRASSWWLERRFPDRWGDRQRIDLNAKVATTWLELMNSTDDAEREAESGEEV
jgi:transposase